MKLTKLIARKGGMGEREIVLMDYALKSILNDISKLALYTMLAFIAGVHRLFFVVCIPYMVVRIFTGGIHMKTYWGCFFFTFLSLSGMMGTATILKDHWNIVFLLTSISLLIIPIIGPMPSRNKKKMSKRKRYVFVCLGLIIEVMVLITAKVELQDSRYQMGAMLSLLINNIQLIILKSRRWKHEEGL